MNNVWTDEKITELLRSRLDDYRFNHSLNVAESAKELNYFRVPASGVFKRSFVLLNFSGKESARCLTVKFFDSKGAELFSQKIDLSDISAFN